MAKIAVSFPLWKSIEWLYGSVFAAETPEGDVYLVGAENPHYDFGLSNKLRATPDDEYYHEC